VLLERRPPVLKLPSGTVVSVAKDGVRTGALALRAGPRRERCLDARAHGGVRTKTLRNPDLSADWNVRLRGAWKDASPARLDKRWGEKGALDPERRRGDFTVG